MCTKMEQPFYHDDSFLPGYGRSSEPVPSDLKLLKAGLALNQSDPYRGSALKGHRGGEVEGVGYFGSDAGAVASLKLASSELERLIIQNSNGGVITSPGPGQYFYTRGVTQEQEGFADGFVKALDDLHKMNHMTAPPNVSIGGSHYNLPQQQEPPVYANLGGFHTPAPGASSYPTATISYLPQPHYATSTFKEEPQTVPDSLRGHDCSSSSSPPVSPINLEDQERIKVERKRLRNRLAATKCRKRKLERIARLEDKVRALKNENSGLQSAAGLLREQVGQLKHKVLSHVQSGCQLLLSAKMQPF